MTPADRAYVEEFAAESTNLMRRALAYAAQKRAEENAKLMAMGVKKGNFNSSKKPDGKEQKPSLLDSNNKKTGANSTSPIFERVKSDGRGRIAKTFIYEGEEKTLAQWADDYGLSYATLHHRIWRGIPFEEALTMGKRRMSSSAKVNLSAAKAEAKEKDSSGGGSELSPVG